MKLTHLILSTALVVTAPPLLSDLGLPTGDNAAVAKNGNGNGNGGGNGNGKGGGKGGGAEKAQNGKAKGNMPRAGATKTAAARGKGKTNLEKRLNRSLARIGLIKTPKGNAARKSQQQASSTPRKSKAVRTAPTLAAVEVAPRPKPKNLNARLKSLNSLNRNVNGFLNGKDPKLDPLRAFAFASAGTAGLTEELAAAQEALMASEEEYAALISDLGVEATDPEGQRAELEAQREALQDTAPEDVESPEYAEWDAQRQAVEDGLAALDALAEEREAVADLEGEVAEAGEDVSEEALREAIAEAMNATGNRTITPEEIDQDIVDFVSRRLGVGEAEGFIDEIIAREAAAEEEGLEEEPLEPVDAAAEEEGDGTPILVEEET